ncbi:MAG: hypothetical protein CL675_02145 [Bdellovibrionaceae bacterium]|nr:hypothetical protein [Pseudobdellovibrionaceae bacterium]
MTVADQSLKTKADLHIARKLWHMGGVLSIIAVYLNISRPDALALATSLTVFAFTVDFVRLRSEAINSIVVRVFGVFMRASERTSWSGASFLMLGVLVCVSLFEKRIALLALLFLAICDPAASYFGVKYGRDKLIGNKSLQGTAAAFLICTGLSAVYFSVNGFMIERLLIASLIAGLIGAFAELISIAQIDDNFTLPVLSCAMLHFLFLVFGA